MARNIINSQDDVQFHFYFLCDTTSSMSGYINSMPNTLQYIMPACRLMLEGKAEIRIITYRDYCDSPVLEYEYGINGDLVKFVKGLYPKGGGDTPEAVKTAYNHLLEQVENDVNENSKVKAFVFHYCDAPPHSRATRNGTDSNYSKEVSALASRGQLQHWNDICTKAQDLNITVFTFLNNIKQNNLAFYGLMGPIVYMKRRGSEIITKATVAVFNQILGENFPYSSREQFECARLNKNECLNSVNIMENGGPCSTITYNVLPQFGIDAVVELQGQAINLQANYRNDQKLQLLAYRILDHLFSPQLSHGLVYNSIIKGIWRLCQKTNVRHKQLLEPKLRNCIHALSSPDQQELQKWIN